MFLLDSNLATKDWAGLEAHIQEILKRNKAEVAYAEKWPDRRLSYEVRGCKKGTYYLTYFTAPTDATRAIEHDCKLSERVLRVLIIQEPGLEREMERRKNREITAPPSELSFEDDRFDGGRERDFGFRRRQEPVPEPVSAVAPEAEAPKPLADVPPEGEEAAK